MALQVHEVEARHVPEGGGLLGARSPAVSQPPLHVVEPRRDVHRHPLVPDGPILGQFPVVAVTVAVGVHRGDSRAPFKAHSAHADTSRVTIPPAQSDAAPTGITGVSRLLEQEARIVGIKGFSSPTLEAVDRRRSQLWTVVFAGLVCLAAAVALLTSKEGHRLGFVNGMGFRIGTVVLVVGLAAYVMEKERHLRRLSKLLVDERVLGAALSNRLKELAMLYEAGKAMNSVLVVDEVLQLILSSTFDLLGASSGSIMLLEDEGDLVVVCRAGNASGAPIELGGGIASRVARDREPLLVQGTVSEKGRQETESAVCVPLAAPRPGAGCDQPDRCSPGTSTASTTCAPCPSSPSTPPSRWPTPGSTKPSGRSAPSCRTRSSTTRSPGAANRVLISDRLAHALARVRRRESLVAVLFIDVDNFKLVNDELGHEAGDFVLTAIAQRLAQCVRSSDTVGRFGGDEFLVICEDLTHDAEGLEIAERILQGVQAPLRHPLRRADPVGQHRRGPGHPRPTGIGRQPHPRRRPGHVPGQDGGQGPDRERTPSHSRTRLTRHRDAHAARAPPLAPVRAAPLRRPHRAASLCRPHRVARPSRGPVTSAPATKRRGCR